MTSLRGMVALEGCCAFIVEFHAWEIPNPNDVTMEQSPQVVNDSKEVNLDGIITTTLSLRPRAVSLSEQVQLG